MFPNQELSKIETRIIDNVDSSSSPILVHMLGIPGSGKSSFLKILQNTWLNTDAPKPALLGFDQVMQSMPSYQNMVNKIDGFKEFELPARAAGYRILEGLLKKGAHILFDNGGSADSHPDLMRKARDNLSYRLVFVSMNTPIDVARSRVNSRAVEIGQHTPLHYLEERAAKLEALITTYRTLTPYFYEMDNRHVHYDDFIKVAENMSLQIMRDLGI